MYLEMIGGFIINSKLVQTPLVYGILTYVFCPVHEREFQFLCFCENIVLFLTNLFQQTIIYLASL